MSEHPERPIPWTIGEPSTPLAEPWDESHWHIEVSDGNPLSCNRATIYGPLPEVCRQRAEVFVQAMRGWRRMSDQAAREAAAEIMRDLLTDPASRRELERRTIKKLLAFREAGRQAALEEEPHGY